MAHEPARHLRAINPDTGEIAVSAYELLQDVEMLERDLRTKRRRIKELENLIDADGPNHPLWPEAVAIFRYWQEKCDHGKAEWTAGRFEMIRPLLESHGAEACREAIRGAAFDPFVKKRKNGTPKRYDDFDLIFRSAGKMEDFQARCPAESQPFRKRCLEDHCAEVAKRVLERAKLIEEADDPGTLASLLAEIHRLNLRWLATPDEYIV